MNRINKKLLYLHVFAVLAVVFSIVESNHLVGKCGTNPSCQEGAAFGSMEFIAPALILALVTVVVDIIFFGRHYFIGRRK